MWRLVILSTDFISMRIILLPLHNVNRVLFFRRQQLVLKILKNKKKYVFFIRFVFLKNNKS